jgi:hypothetical protein
MKKFLNLSSIAPYAAISQCCKGKINHYRGYHFEYVKED